MRTLPWPKHRRASDRRPSRNFVALEYIHDFPREIIPRAARYPAHPWGRRIDSSALKSRRRGARRDERSDEAEKRGCIEMAAFEFMQSAGSVVDGKPQ